MPPTPDSARYWVRNEFGRVWGPFGLAAIGRVDLGPGGASERAQIAIDGRNFKPLAEFPEVVRAFAEAKASAPVRRRFVEVAPPPPPPPPPPRAPAAPAAPVEPVAEVVGPPSSGAIEEHAALELYSRIAGPLLTGRLTLDGPSGTTRVYFRKGAPERVEPPHGARELAEFLIRRKVAGESELRDALEMSGGPDGDFVDALYALGIVPAQDVFQLLREHLTEQLERALAVASGAFAWEPDVSPPQGSFPLGHRWGLAAQFVRRYAPGAIRQRLGDRIRRTVYRSSGARASLEELQLTAQELRIAAMLDGTRTPEELSLDLPGETEAVVRLTWLLGEVGHLSFGDHQTAAGAPERVDDEAAAIVEKRSGLEERPAGEPQDAAVVARMHVRSVAVKPPSTGTTGTMNAVKPPSTGTTGTTNAVKPPEQAVSAPAPRPPARKPPKSAPARPPPVMTASQRPLASAPTPAAPVPENEQELEQLVLKWKESNHFEVLGVAAKAATPEIKAAYFGLAKKHHPDNAAAGSENLRRLKADLTARLNEAYAVLGDDETRAKYAEGLRTGGTQEVDIGPILEAEEEFMRATILVKARKYAEAVALLDKAILLNAEEGEFYAWRAFATFVQTIDKRLEYPRAVAECEKALKLAPRCAQAHLFIGQMSRIVGESAKAERAFKAVLELEPDNIEAARELRLSRKG